MVETTKGEGASILCGGKRPANFNKGYFYEATVFDNVKDDFTIMKTEPFGPLSPILSFKHFDEVIERANNSDAGLAAYVATNSIEKAHKTSDALETGMVAINTPLVPFAEAPFGGIKQSGSSISTESALLRTQCTRNMLGTTLVSHTQAWKTPEHR